jgi:r-opsin
MNITTAAALKEAFDPWSLPDTFTVYNFAPEEIHSFLLPHWKTQKAPHPMLYYFFGLLYLIIGKITLLKTFHCYFFVNIIFFIGTTAVFGNLSVLRIFSGNPNLRTPSNMLVLNLAASDLMLMICLLPEAIYNFFTGGPWRFGNLGCQIHAFTGILLLDCLVK